MKENARARFGSACLFTLSLFLPFQACPEHNNTTRHHKNQITTRVQSMHATPQP